MVNQSVKIAPSILSADFAQLGSAVEQSQAAGARWIHVDVMDGHFVPNISMGPVIVRSIRPITDLVIDAHLMIDQPERYIDAFVEAGADHIDIHVESTPHIHRAIQQVKDNGAKAGLALNPGTPPEALREVAHLVDTVLVMTVNPGFSGQVFLESSFDKVARVRAMLSDAGNEAANVTVDGGVSPANAGQLVAAGATVLVAASAIFNADVGIQAAVANLHQGALVK